MCDCRSGISGEGPYATGIKLVEFVLAAHGGEVACAPLRNGGLNITCQGCGESFVLETHVQSCKVCGGVHAVSPPRSNDPSAVQFAGGDFRMPA